jgi:hypothetical protein
MKIHVLVVILGSVLLTGCIEIVEKITVHKNSSGTVKYSIEPGKFSTFLTAMRDYTYISPMEDWEKQMVIFTDKLRKLDGIDSVEYSFNPEKNEYFLKFCFRNITDLNDAIYGILDYKKNVFSPDFMKMSRHRLERKNFVPMLHRYLEQKSIDSTYLEFAELISFKTIIEMPGKLKKANGDNCRISADGGSVIQAHKIAGILENSADLGIKIRY